MHPATAKLLQGLLSWGGVLIGSLLGLSIAKHEQPQASGVFLLVVILNTASAEKGNIRKEGIFRREEKSERTRTMIGLYSKEHSLGSYTAIQEAKEILSCQIWGIT